MSVPDDRSNAASLWKVLIIFLSLCSLGAAVTFPFTMEQVWYRGAKRPFARAFKAGGDLVVREQSLEFVHSKHGWTLPLGEISMITLGPMKGDVDTDWVVLVVKGGGNGGLIGLRDGRKMGYGQETRKMYENLREVARARGAAQFDVPAGLVAYEPLDRMVAMAHPERWSDYQLSQHINEDFILPLGRTTFTPREVVAREDLLTILPRLMVERTDVRKTERATCRSGLSKRLEDQVLAEIGNDPYFLGGAETTLELQSVPWPVGPCKGVRWKGTGRNKGGQSLSVDLMAVVSRGVLYRFSLVASAEVDTSGNGTSRLQDQILETVRLAEPY
jgi:hypothetical protein